MDSADIARYLIQNIDFMVIATADTTGKPWISPVSFTYDGNYNLYWVSSQGAVHSKNIASRSEVAISIFGPLPDGGFDGIYFDAITTELKDAKDIGLGIRLFKELRPQRERFVTHSIEDVTGAADWRMYKAAPVKIYKRAEGVQSGQVVTVRELIKL